MLRTVFLIVVLACAGVAYVYFAREANPTAFGGQKFTAEERAQGLHCQKQQQTAEHPVQSALQARIGPQAQDFVRVIDLELGPVQTDGDQKMTVTYSLDRVGQISETHKATGRMKNADCSFTIATIER